MVTRVNALDVNILYSGSEKKLKCNDKLSGTVDEKRVFILDPCLQEITIILLSDYGHTEITMQ